MCGIAGYFAPEPIDVHEGRQLLSRMQAAMMHRGPDGQGRFVSPSCGLACTRLAIVDVANGHMPIANEDGRVICVMNGEIYNNRQLRERLRARGHVFVNESDSEVIPHLYEEGGTNVMRELTGMFALALWDEERRRLLLARDRFGIKPLFVAQARGMTLFASEVKALLASEYIDRRIDPQALRDLATAGYPMPPRTMFCNVTSLPPASYQTFSADRPAGPHRYFTVPYPGVGGDARACGAAGAVERMRSLFDDVVRDHLIADVPVGSFVSGGIDSVSVAMRASAFQRAPLSTFSMTFSGDEAALDESVHSDLAARAMQSHHTRVHQTAVDEADYRGTIRAMEAPQLSMIAFCLYRLARVVHEAGLKVVLTGEGADEVLAGYIEFKLSRVRRSAAQLSEWRDALGISVHRDLYSLWRQWWRVEPAIEARYGVLPTRGDQWWMFADAWSTALAPPLGEMLAVRPSMTDRLPERPPGLDCERAIDPLHGDLLFEQGTRLDGWVLPMGDRVTMAHSVEARVPFLDHRLVELTAGVPSDLLLRGTREKYLLREAMTGSIPEALRRRAKQPFTAPVDHWLFGSRRPAFVADALSHDGLRRLGIFDHRGVEKLERWLSDDSPDFRRATASCVLNAIVGIQLFAEEFRVAL